MNGPSKRLSLLRRAASSPRQKKLPFKPVAVRETSMSTAGTEDGIPAAQPDPTTTDSEVSLAPTLCWAEKETSCVRKVAPTAVAAACEADATAETAVGPTCEDSFWAAAPPGDLTHYRRTENLAARAAQEYANVLRTLQETCKLPFLCWRTSDELLECAAIARHHLVDMDAVLRGHSAGVTPAFETEGRFQRVQAQTNKFRNLCKDAAKQSKAHAARAAAVEADVA